MNAITVRVTCMIHVGTLSKALSVAEIAAILVMDSHAKTWMNAYPEIIHVTLMQVA